MAGKKGRSGPPGNLNGVVNGRYALKGRLNGTKLDRRSALFKAYQARVSEYVAAIGGDPSPQQMALIHDTVKTEFYANEIEAYLDSLKSRIRKGRAHPLLGTRREHRAHIRENIIRGLGLKRIPRDIPDLAQQLANLRQRDGDDGGEVGR